MTNKILVWIDPDTQRVVPVEATEAMIDAMLPVEEIGYWAMLEAAIAVAPQPEPVDIWQPIEQETAEAIARYLVSLKYMILQPTQTYSAGDLCQAKKNAVLEISKAIRSGAWKEYK